MSSDGILVHDNNATLIVRLLGHLSESENAGAVARVHTVLSVVEDLVGSLESFRPNLGPAGVRVGLLRETKLLLERLVHVLLLVEPGHLDVELGKGTVGVDAAHLDIEQGSAFRIVLVHKSFRRAGNLEELGVLETVPLDAARLHVDQSVFRCVHDAQEQVVVVAALVEYLRRRLGRLRAVTAVHRNVVQREAVRVLDLDFIEQLSDTRIKAPLIVHHDVGAAGTISHAVNHL